MADATIDQNQVRLNEIDVTVLTPVVRKALGRESAEVTEWSVGQIHGGTGGGGGGTAIYRFAGEAEDGGSVVPWSVILKIVDAKPGESPDSTHYWKREAEAYASGLLDDIPGPLSAARCYGVVEYPDEACWIWQEAVLDGTGGTWEMEHYRLSARYLGHFNGAYLTDRLLPAESWLSTQWLRHAVQRSEEGIDGILAMLQSLCDRGVLGSDFLGRFMFVWEQRNRVLDVLDRLPQTMCHQDACRPNLFLRRSSEGGLETVAIDWAYIGIAPVGLEIAVNWFISLMFLFVDVDEMSELRSTLVSGYVAGLADAGYAADERVVWLGMTLSVTCKFFEAVMIEAHYGLLNPENAAMLENVMRHPVADVLRTRKEVFEEVLRSTEMALVMAEEMGY